MPFLHLFPHYFRLSFKKLKALNKVRQASAEEEIKPKIFESHTERRTAVGNEGTTDEDSLAHTREVTAQNIESRELRRAQSSHATINL
mmetsp:Transcript_47858/g.94425  ORF Transcript_47858/g.94425 Transcript_47858/m.94425 type:complete len:88 (+) Transcript_47858:372-635(+)